MAFVIGLILQIMIYNLTYNNPERWREIHAICGEPLSLWENLKIGGSGSPRLWVHSCPEPMQDILDETADRQICNIQIMSRGLIFRFRSRLEAYGIPIAWTNLESIEYVPLGNGADHILRFSFTTADENYSIEYLVRVSDRNKVGAFLKKAPFRAFL